MSHKTYVAEIHFEADTDREAYEIAQKLESAHDGEPKTGDYYTDIYLKDHAYLVRVTERVTVYDSDYGTNFRED